MEPVIQVSGLHKAYGDFEAVRGIDFEVSEGEIFGLLGPNGAGKTTTVEILEGLRARSQGQVKVLGFDPEVSKQSLKDRIGVCLQATNLPDKLRVHEALEWFAAFYSRKADCDKLLQRLQLWEKRNDFYSKLSGGQKQRVALALALVNEPNLVFLDEPTTGLDPQVRLEIHSLIEELKANKRTILLTTHYIEEAERLCDRVAIIEHGSIIEMGSPADLVRRHCPERTVVLDTAEPLANERLSAIPSLDTVTQKDSQFTLQGNGEDFVTNVIQCLSENRIRVTNFRTVLPNLEDVFLKLTGHSMRD
jgi:ABC-2 type transport system ATP-binding protein